MNIYLSGDFMLNYIWSGMIVISLLASFFNGTSKEVCTALCDGASDGVTLALGIAGIMAFWTGIMKIAENSGLVKIIAFVFKPLIGLLFPEAKKDSEVCGAIAMNMTANFFGMGNAATPLGLNAMKRLGRYSDKQNASASMCMLAVVNSASIQLIPSTLIALRAATGSKAPAEIIVPIWIVSVATFVFGVTLCKLVGKKYECI